MKKQEKKLLEMIENSTNPKEAAKVAIEVILCYAEQFQRPATYYPIPPLETDETN